MQFGPIEDRRNRLVDRIVGSTNVLHDRVVHVLARPKPSVPDEFAVGDGLSIFVTDDAVNGQRNMPVGSVDFHVAIQFARNPNDPRPMFGVAQADVVRHVATNASSSQINSIGVDRKRSHRCTQCL